MHEYTIHGGDAGKARLEILTRTLAASTERFLNTAALESGSRCLDLGCGAGGVSLALARQLGVKGQVLGLDMDERKIQSAAASAAGLGIKNVRFQVGNAYELHDESAYDLVYSRFLLSHLNQPKAVLRRIWLALRANGRFLIEDTDFSGHCCYPESRPFHRYVTLYQRLLKQRGADADLGQKLVGLLQEAGFVDLQFQISQPFHLEGEGKLMAEITFDGIAQALMDEGLITMVQARRILAGLINFRKRPDSLISLPRIFQVSGRRPG